MEKFKQLGQTNQEMLTKLRKFTESSEQPLSITGGQSGNEWFAQSREQLSHQNSLSMRRHNNSSKRSKRRSVTTDADSIGATYRVMSQSEQYVRNDEGEEDLLFNMSMIE